MQPIDALSILIAITVACMGTVGALIAWIGTRLANKLDAVADTLGTLEVDLRGDLAELDRRVSVIEARCPCATRGNHQ